MGDFNEMAYHAEYIKISALKISYSFFYSKRVSLAKRALSRFAEILAYKKVLRVTECGVRKRIVRLFVKIRIFGKKAIWQTHDFPLVYSD